MDGGSMGRPRGLVVSPSDTERLATAEDHGRVGTLDGVLVYFVEGAIFAGCKLIISEYCRDVGSLANTLGGGSLSE